METCKIKVRYYDSPCGRLLLGAFGDKLCLCDWDIEKRRIEVDRKLQKILHTEYEISSSPVIDRACSELDEYFLGDRLEFDIPILFVGTDFQCRVWSALQTVPYGKRMAYSEFSCKVATVRSVRAVASAIGANPVSVFVPCHRIVGCNGTLNGYAGGLEAKRFLLDLEYNTVFRT